MDMIMPRMGGMECLREIMKFDKSAMILMVSADLQDTQAMDTIKEGSLGYVRKPFKKRPSLKR
jgi:DNA-binding NarL/FixJ family response regulator